MTVSAWRRRRFQLFVNLYPPYLGAGVRVTRIADDFHSLDVEMRLRPWSRSYVGTHFGGSLFSMVDPFFMIMLIVVAEVEKLIPVKRRS